MNIVRRNMVATLLDPQCHPLNRQIGAGQRHKKQDHSIATRLAVAQELRKGAGLDSVLSNAKLLPD